MADEVKEVEKKTAVVVAIPAAAAGITGEKQGAKCCGCCCDYRRAVIVMAIIGMCFTAIYLILGLVGVGLGSSGIFVGVSIVALCFYIFQLFAALKCNVCMLYTVIVFELIAFALQIYNAYVITWDLGGLIVAFIINGLICALIIYPTAGLISEIKSGIMSAETYPREAYSCCCTPQV